MKIDAAMLFSLLSAISGSCPRQPVWQNSKTCLSRFIHRYICLIFIRYILQFELVFCRVRFDNLLSHVSRNEVKKISSISEPVSLLVPGDYESSHALISVIHETNCHCLLLGCH